MKHHAQFPLVPIASANGVWLTDLEGNRYLDAVSSWWVNLFGHANPVINAAIKSQLDTLEHAMLAGFTHAPAVELAERLQKLTGLGHAFFACDGASAVEISLKMSFHYWQNSGRAGKNKFVSLEGSYHGETLGALSVTDVKVFSSTYAPLLNNNLRVAFPAANQTGQHDSDGIQHALDALEALLAVRHHEIAALILEPLVQGAAGMRMYPASYLQRARALTRQYDVHLIADEIMTGFGRTGTMFAWEQAGNHGEVEKPDFICLSKGITGGYLPLSCVLTTDTVYDAFYDDDVARGFLHSHSYTGSALACRAALATLDIFEANNVIIENRVKATRFNVHSLPIRKHAQVCNFRHLGMIWAFDVLHNIANFAQTFFAAALKRGVLLRPIGNTIYFMPPYIITDQEFQWLVQQTMASLNEVLA